MTFSRRLITLTALGALAALPACASCDGDDNNGDNGNNSTTPDNNNSSTANNTNTGPNTTPNNTTGNTLPNNSMGNTLPNNSTGNTLPNNSTGNTIPNNSTPNNMPGMDVVECSGAVPASSSGDVCDVVSGSGANVVLRGTVLSGDTIYENGAVIVEGGKENGKILYVGCDWEAQAEAMNAAQVNCAEGVISPGLVNAHDHITFNAHGKPVGHGDERFEHRHDWRKGKRGHTQVDHFGGKSNSENVLFAEMRHLLAGTTSLAGSGGAKGLLRNLDQSSNNGGLSDIRVDYSTFPLGDSGGALKDTGCDYGGGDGINVLQNTIYLPHVAEGIDAESRNEFVCLAGAGGADLIGPNTSIVHGIGLQANDIAQMAAEGTKLVWSPRSNIDLYGQTADIPTHTRLGVTVALGTDWIISGSMNTLRELQCADFLNKNYYNNTLSDRELWKMVTRNGAVALGVEDRLGTLEEGQIADIAIFDLSSKTSPYRAVIDAGVKEVVMVMRGGAPLVGEAAAIDALAGADAAKCEALEICSSSRKVCTELDTGFTLQQLEANLDAPKRYELFYCDTPPEEPSCLPARPGEYTGTTGGADIDGDGIEDAADSCPDIFNPKRPLDNNEQPNFDMDTQGDSCDICPISGPGDMCAMFDPNDPDGDGVPSDMDNCPQIPNMNQANADGDDKGDLCDSCPDAANDGDMGCPATLYAINNGQFAEGEAVVVSDVIVTGSGDGGFFVQVAADSMDFNGADFSGMYVYAPNLMPLPARGDRLTIDASVGEFQGGAQLTSPTVTVEMAGMSPAPLPTTVAELLRTGAKGEAYEGLLVELTNAVVADVSKYDQFGELTLEGGLSVDDILYEFEKPEVGDTYSKLVGCVAYRGFYGMGGENGLAPRDANDLVTGPADIDRFSASSVYIEANTTSTGMPELTLELTSTALMPVVVALSSDSADLTVPATITIPQGDTSATISLTAGAMTGMATLTATYNTTMITTQVIIYDATTPRTVTELTPAAASVPPGGMVDLAVKIDVPAPAGGQLVSVTTTGDLSAPATVTIPQGMLEGTITVTANATGAMGTVTAAVGLGAGKTATVTLSNLPSECLIISEYVEGSSNNKALELYNCNPSVPLDLTPFHICLVSNEKVECGNKLDLMGTLAGGATMVLCNSALSDKTSCTLESNVTNFNGNDRILLFRDDMANGTYDPQADTLMDAFGDYDLQPMAPNADPWKDVTLRRCNLSPYTGPSGSFDAANYYSTAPKDDFSGLGVPPSTQGCNP